MPKIFITSILSEQAIKKLSEHNIEIIQNMSYDILSKKQIISYAKDCDGLITLLSNKIDKEIIDSLPNLKIISNCAVGYNNIDYKYAADKNIWVTNTPEVLTNATAELTIALLLATSRRIVEADKFTREGKFKGWQIDLMLGKELINKNVGIIGLGRIGKAFAKKLSGFDVNLFYYDIKRDKEFEDKYNAKFLSFKNLIKKVDFLSLNLPLTEKSKHLINEEAFSLMRDGIVIVNVARGEIIDEKALIKNLKSKKVFAAGLDVYEFEPQISKELLKLDNVILLPHIGSATIETRAKMIDMVVNNIISFFKSGKPINYIVDITKSK